MPITGLNVLNTFHHTSKADRWIEAKSQRLDAQLPHLCTTTFRTGSSSH